VDLAVVIFTKTTLELWICIKLKWIADKRRKFYDSSNMQSDIAQLGPSFLQCEN
jgi:hypothetical protein